MAGSGPSKTEPTGAKEEDFQIVVHFSDAHMAEHDRYSIVYFNRVTAFKMH